MSSRTRWFSNSPSSSLLLLGLVYILRIASATQDGLSDRAIVDGVMVGWWSWHVAGWICRDLMQLYLLVMLGKSLGMRRLRDLRWLPWLALHAGINYLLHNFVYWWVVAHRNLFLW